MTDHDYNRRIAEALGWTNLRECLPSGVLIGDHADVGMRQRLPLFKTDWSQLPAILAALDEFAGWHMRRIPLAGDPRYFIESNVVRNNACVTATGNTLLLAAGALLLRLKEQPC